MPRFVILEHDHPIVHWDLMLETGDALQTWRLAKSPTHGTGPIDATALGDHRRAYLDYEGPVSGRRGSVKHWDAGVYTEAPESTAEVRIFIVEGTRIRGRFRLRQIEGVNFRFEWDVSAAPPP